MDELDHRARQLEAERARPQPAPAKPSAHADLDRVIALLAELLTKKDRR